MHILLNYGWAYIFKSRAVTKTWTGPDHTDRIYAMYFTDHGPCFRKIYLFTDQVSVLSGRALDHGYCTLP